VKTTAKGLVPQRVYRKHMLQSMGLAGIVICVSLAIGIVGYHVFGGLPWVDALVNASMILGGMGPVDPITRTDGKWFESIYALYSGVALLTSVGVLFAPALHKFLHRFHLETQEAEEGERRGKT
jgi:xanthine/uracil permease